MNKKVFFLSKAALTTSLIYSFSILAAPTTLDILVGISQSGNSRPLEKFLAQPEQGPKEVRMRPLSGVEAQAALYGAYRDSMSQRNRPIYENQIQATNTSAAEKRLAELKEIYKFKTNFITTNADGSPSDDSYKHGEPEIREETVQVFQKYQLRDPKNTLNAGEPVFLVYGVAAPEYRIEERPTEYGTEYVETHNRFNPKWYLQIGGDASTGSTFVELESEFKGGRTTLNGFFEGPMITEVSTPSFPTGKMPLFSYDATKSVNLGNLVFDRLHQNKYNYNVAAASAYSADERLPHSALGHFETGPIITVRAQAQMQQIDPAQATSYKYAFYKVDSKDPQYEKIAIVSAVPDHSTNYDYMNETPKLFIVDLASGQTHEIEIIDKGRGLFGTSFFDLQGLNTMGSTVPYIDPIKNKNLGSLILGQGDLKVTIPFGKHIDFFGRSFAEVTNFRAVSQAELMDLKLAVPRVMGPMFPGVKNLISPYSYFRERLAGILPEIRGLTLGGVARKGEAISPEKANELSALGIKVFNAPPSDVFARGNGQNPMDLFNKVHAAKSAPSNDGGSNQLIIAGGPIVVDPSANETSTKVVISKKAMCLGKYTLGK
ncbi:MAG: hypothetical protein L6Q37_04755 [Bdellovibrionaceae bacterium]|nr:hypothetical protein [Pseudobdellovibrionaceae bacterium]NUM58409.1 hypothetical protein [Pseudobdellovibrionaceae bacterium]